MEERARWVVAASLAVGLAAGGLVASAAAAPAASSVSAAPGQTALTVQASAGRDVYKPRKRFAREFTRRGDRDRSTSHIEHVRELQYRLRWAGVYNGPVTGTFAHRTYRAVKRFQRRHHLEVTGKANVRTWKKLIPKTVRGRGAIPPRCKRGRGWDICYDRKRHQVTLWKSGKLWNSWLVRGGSSSHPTRVGRFKVFYRDKDHVSSLYDSPMPHSQFFSGGQAFHGSALMMDPFVGHSHGCVNMYREDARQLWQLTAKHPLKVRVYGAWD
jgi:Putative peptidoglycan binding domain/L,D-transpeptidase catalytic domain